jgi:hypothetical protein
MDLPIHDDILWLACVKASKRLKPGSLRDPRALYPYLVRGSWMNDMNQVSPLLDKLGKDDIGPQQSRLFQGLWRLELNDLMHERAAKLKHNEPLIANAAGILAAPQNVDGFGRYNPFDHLDVTIDVPNDEYDGAFAKPERFGRAVTANATVRSHVVTRLRDSSLVDDRFSPERITVFGRALHTIADFFAHSNYVELLLWSLAWRGRLDPNLVATFNLDDGSTDASELIFRCPLPANAPRAADALRNAVMWYGASPDTTPLVSALFDKKDTLFSLLHIYAAHLKRADGKDQTDDALDIAMSVFDIQGATLIKGAYEVLSAVEGAFRSIGRLARSELAKGLRSAAEGRDPETQEMMNLTADLVNKFDLQKANDWARAGKLQFLARDLQLQMAEGLANQHIGQPRLPHHALLAKDHANEEAGGALRFKLACLLATEVTARVIDWHFDPTKPALDDYKLLASTVLIHPWQLLTGAPNRDQVIAQRVQQANTFSAWQVDTLGGLDIMAGVT